MKKITIADFSGGEKNAFSADDFAENEFNLLRGFILVKNYVLRSQPPLQRIGSESGFREIRPIVAADGTQMLVGIKDNGEVWKCVAPGVDATYTTANSVSWSRVQSANGPSLDFTVGPNAHFLCDVAFQQNGIAANLTVPALLINQSYTPGTSATDGPVFIWAQTASFFGAYRVLDSSNNAAIYPGYLPAAPSNVTASYNSTTGNVEVFWAAGTDPGMAALQGFKVYTSDGTLRVTAPSPLAVDAAFPGTAADTDVIVRGYNAYGTTPLDADGGITPPSPGYVPHANVGAFWAGQVILGDIEYYKNTTELALGQPLTQYNSTRIRNGIWFSNPDAETTFDPMAVFTVGQPDSQITGMVVVPQGLLIFTKTISNDSGVFLLRGTSAGVVLEEELALNFTLELIRGGVGTRGFTDAGGAFNHVKAWPATGTVAFLDENSLVWQTNTQSVTHISENIQAPQSSGANSSDSLAAWDKYLLFGAYSQLYVLREFGDRGGWTEFVLPTTTITNPAVGSPGPFFLQEMGNSVYFIWNNGTNKQVWRYNMQPSGSAQAEFGKINGELVDLTITTRPVRGGDDPHAKTFWHRVGLRFRGTGSFTIKSMTSAPYIVYGTGAPVSPSEYTVTNSPPTSYGLPANFRGEKTYPMHGPSNEAQVRFVIQGSTEIEDISLYFHGRKPTRP